MTSYWVQLVFPGQQVLSCCALLTTRHFGYTASLWQMSLQCLKTQSNECHNLMSVSDAALVHCNDEMHLQSAGSQVAMAASCSCMELADAAEQSS